MPFVSLAIASLAVALIVAIAFVTTGSRRNRNERAHAPTHRAETGALHRQLVTIGFAADRLEERAHERVTAHRTVMQQLYRIRTGDDPKGDDDADQV